MIQSDLKNPRGKEELLALPAALHFLKVENTRSEGAEPGVVGTAQGSLSGLFDISLGTLPPNLIRG